MSIQSGSGSARPRGGFGNRATDPSERTFGSSFQTLDWATLVAQIKAGDEIGMEQLEKVFRVGVRYYLCRQLGPQDLEDRVSDTFLTIANAIKRGNIGESYLLRGFVRKVVREQVATHIDKAVDSRCDEIDPEGGVAAAARAQSPEHQAIIRQKADLIQRSLSVLSEKDREVLVRFYLHEQTQAQICREMDLTETQFKLTKSTFNAKFGDVGRKAAANGILSL